jgi:hypothetical protein
MKKLIYIFSACFGLLLADNAQGQTAASDNIISESVTFGDMPKGRGVYGIFEGRSPCEAISRQLGAKMPADVDHLKWQLILFRDSVTLKPTTFTLTTEMFGRKPLAGSWRIAHGAKNSLGASYIVLDWRKPDKPLYLLKGDENVLFILDENLDFLSGDLNFSYTLNRVTKVKKPLPQ